jgi:drug/metabolite transporter (DMT)-like permease
MTIPLRVILIAIVIHTLWGGNPVAAKLAFVAFPPLWSAFLRFAMGVSCLIVWAHFRGIRLTPDRREWAGLGWCSVLFFIQIALLNIGTDLTSGSLAAILIATNPLFSAMCAHFVIAGDRLTRVKSLGLGVAFMGVVLILACGADFDAASNTGNWGNWGNWIVLVSAALLGARLIFTARLVRHIDPTRVIIWQMILSMPPFLVAALWFETITWARLDWTVAAGLAYQGVLIAGIGFVVTAELMKRYTPSVMTGFGFISPLSGVLLSMWLLSESPGWAIYAGLAMVGGGLFVMTREAKARV